MFNHFKLINLNIIVLLIFLNQHNAFAINCKAAHELWEVTVCGNEDLLKLDSELNIIYNKCIKSLKNAAEIKKEQKEWINQLAWTNQDQYSLEEKYQNRIENLRKIYFNKMKVHSEDSIVSCENNLCRETQSLEPDPEYEINRIFNQFTNSIQNHQIINREKKKINLVRPKESNYSIDNYLSSNRVKYLKDMYTYYQAKKVHQEGPVLNAKNIPYRWITESLDGNILIKFPQLTDNNNPHTKAINSAIIKNYWPENVLDAYDCDNYDVFSYSIDAKKANLFGISLAWDTCYCGCASHDTGGKDNYLWDMENGKEISNILTTPFLLDKSKVRAFWKQLAKYKNTTMNKVIVNQEEESCRDLSEDEFEWKDYVPIPSFSLDKNGIIVSDVVNDSTACPNCCGMSTNIPYSKYKEFYLKLNPEFIHYFNRFVEAELLSKEQAKNYLKILK